MPAEQRTSNEVISRYM